MTASHLDFKVGELIHCKKSLYFKSKNRLTLEFNNNYTIRKGKNGDKKFAVLVNWITDVQSTNFVLLPQQNY